MTNLPPILIICMAVLVIFIFGYLIGEGVQMHCTVRRLKRDREGIEKNSSSISKSPIRGLKEITLRYEVIGNGCLDTSFEVPELITFYRWGTNLHSTVERIMRAIHEKESPGVPLNFTWSEKSIMGEIT